MTTDDLAAGRLRKRLRWERRRRGWSQTDLANEAGVVRATIQKLEYGRKLSEGVEGAVETALGWELGGLDRIRADVEPVMKGAVQSRPLAEWDRYQAMDRATQIVEETGDENAGTAFMLRWAEAVKQTRTAEVPRS